ncbi:MAG: hypothetical protein IKH57_03280, partial [Clostridia bacterium]|nr:hypothetical protein [Clostridia bacterium]
LGMTPMSFRKISILYIELGERNDLDCHLERSGAKSGTESKDLFVGIKIHAQIPRLRFASRLRCARDDTEGAFPSKSVKARQSPLFSTSFLLFHEILAPRRHTRTAWNAA